jgi:hypothetical protein
MFKIVHSMKGGGVTNLCPNKCNFASWQNASWCDTYGKLTIVQCTKTSTGTSTLLSYWISCVWLSLFRSRNLSPKYPSFNHMKSHTETWQNHWMSLYRMVSNEVSVYGRRVLKLQDTLQSRCPQIRLQHTSNQFSYLVMRPLRTFYSAAQQYCVRFKVQGRRHTTVCVNISSSCNFVQKLDISKLSPHMWKPAEN